MPLPSTRVAFGHGSLSRGGRALAPGAAELACALGRLAQDAPRPFNACRSSSRRVQEASITLSQAPTSVSGRGSRR